MPQELVARVKPVSVTIAVLAGLGALVAALAIGLRSGSDPVSTGKEAGSQDGGDAIDESGGSDSAPLLESAATDVEAPAQEPAREELLPPDEKRGTSIAPPPPDSAPVRGFLADEATGEPLPFYALRVRDAGGRREEIMTDEHGRYATASAMASGMLRFGLVDSIAHPRSLPEIVRERAARGGEAPDVDLSVASGPTYHFEITLPAGAPTESPPPNELRARLHVANRDAQIALDAEPLRAAGDDPWVRFAPVPEKFDRAESIDLESKDGLWVGEGKVIAVRGDVPGIVRIELEARGVLQGQVVDTHGDAIEGARILLEGATNAGKSLRAGTTTSHDGAFRFATLRQGSGTLSVRSLRHAPKDVQVRIVAGQLATQSFVLMPLPSAGAIRGSLESQTGTFDPGIDIALRPIESAAFSGAGPTTASVRASWQTVDGRRIGAFSFEGLPAGKYEVGVRDDGWFRWDPRSLVVSPPSAEARFLVHDDLAHAEFAFRARDSDSGARLDGFYASIQVQGGAPSWKKLSSEAAALSLFPLERGFRWRLDLDGYRPASGDEKAFAVEEVRGNRVWRLAEVDLQRGWGEVFRVVGSAKNKPVAGASVRLDGRDAGTTGNDGMVTVGCAERPRRVEVVFRDWKPTEPVDLRPPWSRREKRFIVVKLAPPQPPAAPARPAPR